MKRLPNNYGGVSHLKDKKRKNPYMAWIPRKKIVSGKVQKKYYDDVLDVLTYIEGKDFINKEFRDDLLKVVNEYSKDEFEIKRTRMPLGYFPTRQDALNALAEYNRMPIDAELKNITFNGAWQSIRTTLDLSQNTLKGYDSAYKHCADLYDRKVSALRTIDFQRCIDAIPESSRSMQGNVKVIINYVCQYAVEQDIASKNYGAFVKMPPLEKKVKNVFTHDEIVKIWEHRDYRHQISSRSYPNLDVPRIFILLLYTGMRISELLSIRKEDINIKERIITVHGTKTENATRSIPIHKDIIKMMKCSHYLVETEDGNPINYKSFSKHIVPAYFEHMGFDHTVHETRHTFISAAQECKLNQVILHKIVGHSSKDITEQTYTHISNKALVKEIDLLVLPKC